MLFIDSVFALMRGRELKCKTLIRQTILPMFALMRGRELKFAPEVPVAADERSPSCEGGS